MKKNVVVSSIFIGVLVGVSFFSLNKNIIASESKSHVVISKSLSLESLEQGNYLTIGARITPLSRYIQLELKLEEAKQLVEQRLAEERRLEEERLAEEKRLEEERLAEERRLEEERLAEERRLEEERLAEEKRLEEERLAQQQTESEVGTTSGFYQNIITVSDPNSILVLVNKNYALSSSYAPSDLVLPNVLAVGHQQNTSLYMRQEAARQLEVLFNAAKEEAGLTLLARSGYRSYQTQASLYRQYVNQNGQSAADRFSARAGHSEHQTGLAMDVTADSVNGQLVTSFGNTAEGIWLKNNAHRFGYIIRYLEGREAETGYQYEPWHIRYVGVEAATTIYQNNWTLEQYLNK